MKGKTNMSEASLATVANDRVQKAKHHCTLESLISSVEQFGWRPKKKKMEETINGRRERRRRKTEAMEFEFEKPMENIEFSTDSHVAQSIEKVVLRDTHCVVRSTMDLEVVGSPKGSGGASIDSGQLTYSLSERSVQRTFDAGVRSEKNDVRPVPAPRKRKSRGWETEKLSSDTDRDVTEIDLDEPRPKSDFSPPAQLLPEDLSESADSKSVVVPVPKPRKTAKTIHREDSSEKSNERRSPSRVESYEEKTDKLEDDHKTENDSPAEPNELPMLAELQEEARTQETKEKTKRQKKTIGDLLDRKGKKKKSKTFSVLMKLERKKIPKISTILRDLKDEEEEKGEKGKGDAQEDKFEFQILSQPYTESVQNGQIYVQGKNGFRAREREEVLRSGSGRPEKDGGDGMTANSTANAAVLIQKYWSRTMTYFHGVLAGLGFSHAATVTAIMLHCNYDPREFVGVYSCLSLKIHYAFYTLTTLCIVSCFDRIDIGHMNRKHWDEAWRAPSAWIVLVVYAIAFALTLANQVTEARFDAVPGGNETEVWGGQTGTEVQMQLLQWYHGVWARDILVLFAWLVIALTKFDDLLLSHIGNMACCADPKGEDKVLRQKTEYT